MIRLTYLKCIRSYQFSSRQRIEKGIVYVTETDEMYDRYAPGVYPGHRDHWAKGNFQEISRLEAIVAVRGKMDRIKELP